jgi:glycosyltransferase involved in cell wall biosynthesis
MKTISYAITVNNEVQEIRRLLDQIVLIARPEDEIVVLQDETGLKRGDKDCDSIRAYVVSVLSSNESVKYLTSPLNGDFASFKNVLRINCHKDYIFFLDADEYLSETLSEQIYTVVDNNHIDVLRVPRLNTVTDLTEEHVRKWGWSVDDRGRVNWPDFQMRIVANKPNIRWEGKVHERIVGYETIGQFPTDTEDWCIVHPKTIERQEKQNEFYEQL